MTSPADPGCGHTVVSARALALVTSSGALRRLRALWRGNPEIYESLYAISVTLAFANESKIAIPAAARHAGFMTVTEYAAAASVTPQAVRLACRQGRIRAIKRAGVWLIPAAELTIRELAC